MVVVYSVMSYISPCTGINSIAKNQETKIVDNVSYNSTKHQLEEIYEVLKNIRINLAKQDTILKDILLKLDDNN